ncbi:MAG: hypothetical protein Q7R78_01290 [bacterium]|nr:hypothetical protein [bacterium]
MEPNNNTIPKNVEDYIFSSDFESKFDGMDKKLGLHIDQMGELITLTTLLASGRLPRERFVNSISEKLEVNRDEANKIAEHVNAIVLIPLREMLKTSINPNIINSSLNIVDSQLTNGSTEIVKVVNIPPPSIIVKRPEATEEKKPEINNSYKIDPYREQKN